MPARERQANKGRWSTGIDASHRDYEVVQRGARRDKMRSHPPRQFLGDVMMRYWHVLVVGLWVGASSLAFAEPPADQSDDPLPDGALLRLGSTRFHPPSSVYELAVSPDGKVVVSVGDQLMAWDAETGKELWRASPDESDFRIRGTGYGGGRIAFSSDSSRFYTPGGHNRVFDWNTMSGAHEILTIDLPRPKLETRNIGATSVDVTADGQYLCVGSDTCLAITNHQGELLCTIDNTRDGPPKIDNDDRLTFGGDYSYGRFSPDGKLLALVMSGRPERLSLREVPTGRELRRIEMGAKLVRLAFSPDGTKIVATERDNAVRLYDVGSGEPVWSQVIKLTNPYENYTSDVAFSPDGKSIAAGATDHHIYVLDPATGEQRAQLVGHAWYPWALAFTSDSKLLYSSGWDGAIRRWDVAARKQLDLPAGRRASGVVAASPDGRTLAYVDDSGTIRLVDAISGDEHRSIELPETGYSHLIFSPDGQRLAGGGSCRDDVHVAVWNTESGALVYRWNWPKGRDPHSTAESLSFSPDGTRLAADVFRQSMAYLWNLETGKQIAELPHKQVYGLSFSPEGKTLATAGWDSMVHFWDVETGKLLREFQIPEEAKGGDLRMYAVRYASEGGLIATAHLDGTVRVWQAEQMQLRTQFSVPGRFVFGATEFSPDGLWLATGSMGGHVELWDPLTGTKVWNRGRHQGYVSTVSFGRDNQTVATGGSSDDVCYLWDLQPHGVEVTGTLEQLWHDLAGDDSAAAYQAMWALAKQADKSVAFLADKLRPVRSLVDPDHVAKEDSPDERQRIKELKKLLAEKDPTVELEIAMRRAVSVLAQTGSTEARDVLRQLAERDPKGDVASLASVALARLSVRQP
jgi:WD40 repeat protein